MARKTEARRADLRNRLIDIADAWIAEDGMARIKARPLAAEAGCAIGAIYNVFSDLNELVMEVNSRTFARLGKDVGEKGQDPDLAPTEALTRLAMAYLEFARNHPKAWRTLFDLRLTDDMDVPQWYLDELKQMFVFIAGPVARLYPELDEKEVELMSRALFSAVHGIVTLGLENRISGVPPENLEAMIKLVLQRLS